MRIVILIFLSLIYFFAGSCAQQTPVSKTKKEAIELFPRKKYIISTGGYSHTDSLEFKRVGDNLYSDYRNKLYFLAYDRSDESGKTVVPVFIRCFYNSGETKKNDTLYDIGNIIDVPTFRKIGDGYYRDRRNGYYFTEHADGGEFDLQQGDSTMIKLKKGFYLGAFNKMYIKTSNVPGKGKGREIDTPYYREVPFVDVSSYADFGKKDGYAKDKDHVYYREGAGEGDFMFTMESADVSSFVFSRVNTAYGWDKKNVYVKGYSDETVNRDSLIRAQNKK